VKGTIITLDPGSQQRLEALAGVGIKTADEGAEPHHDRPAD
jgi:hypothetical protein